MKEIKFRAKGTDAAYNNEWLYGYVWGNKKGQFFIDFGSGTGCEINPETIGHYIGVRDKHGQEIYEGDIVRAWSQGQCGKFQVKWREDGGGSPMFILYPAWQHGEMWRICASREEDGKVYDRGLEVIGDIHDNKTKLPA